MRNSWFSWGVLAMIVMLFWSCDDEVTYSDMKERERSLVNNYIVEQGINVISYSQFVENDSTTDFNKNEYVLIDDCYMQIERNPKNNINEAPDARQMKNGETLEFLVRFVEYNISEGDTINGNTFDTDNPDRMRVTYEDGSYNATFTDGYMNAKYGGAVPSGWLVAFPYLYFTRHDAHVAKVNLIVPHTKGTSTAATYVYPCYYSITFKPVKLYDTN